MAWLTDHAHIPLNQGTPYDILYKDAVASEEKSCKNVDGRRTESDHYSSYRAFGSGWLTFTALWANSADKKAIFFTGK